MTAGRFWLQVVLALVSFGWPGPAQNYVRDAEPKLFSYEELVQLGTQQELSPELADKLHVLTTAPFINNEAYYCGARAAPSPP